MRKQILGARASLNYRMHHKKSHVADLKRGNIACPRALNTST